MSSPAFKKQKHGKFCGIDPADLETRLFINGEFVNSIGGSTFKAIDPTTEEVICEVQEALAPDVDAAVAAAKAAFDLGAPWREADASFRRNCILKLADLIERDRIHLGLLESLDNGKPTGADGTVYGSAVDLHLMIDCFKYYAGHADKVQGRTIPIDGNFLCYTLHEPVGVVGQIIPWNFPLLMMTWKLAPALAAGCTIVLKTSEKTPLSALHVCKLINEAGFPKGVVNVLSGYGPTAGEHLVRHPDVEKIAFTGSTAVGKRIASICAETNLKNVTLELGGKSPLIIFDDADLDQALGAAQVGLFLNQGQCCCASSRLFVQDTIYDAFVKKCREAAAARTVGGHDTNAEQGPQVDELQFNKVIGYIEKGKQEGAKLETGGSRHGDKGYFIQPTVFSDVTDDMTIAKEEIFGPVMSILKFSTIEEVVQRANKTMYGLAAGICTRDVGKATKVSSQLRAGTVWINCYDNFSMAAPFGGFKQSGHGRELGEYGIQNYIEVKTVMIPMDLPKGAK